MKKYECEGCEDKSNHLIHKEIIIDAHVLSAPKSEKKMRSFMTLMIHSIGMKSAKLSKRSLEFMGFEIPFLKMRQPNPIAWYCKDPDNRGFTGTAILTTSSMSMHFWDSKEPYELHFNLYSCRDFSPKKILKLLDEEFAVYDGTVKFMDRVKGTTTKYRIEVGEGGVAELKIVKIKKRKK